MRPLPRRRRTPPPPRRRRRARSRPPHPSLRGRPRLPIDTTHAYVYQNNTNYQYANGFKWTTLSACYPKLLPMLQEAVDKRCECVVAIRTDHGVGAGWLDYQPSLVVTSYQVVRGCASVDIIVDSYRASDMSRTVSHGEVIAVDVAHDLALVRPHSDLAMLTRSYDQRDREILAKEPPAPGAAIVALGHPSVVDPTELEPVTAGTVLESEGAIRGVAAIGSAAIQACDIGGPVLDESGAIVGMATDRPLGGGRIIIPAAVIRQLYALRSTCFAVEDGLPAMEARWRESPQASVDTLLALEDSIVGLAPGANGTLLALSNDRHALLVIDPRAHRVATRIGLPTDPVAMMPGERANQVWVENRKAQCFEQVDLAAGTVAKTVAVKFEPGSFAVTPTHLWYVNSGLARVVDLSGAHPEATAKTMHIGMAAIALKPGHDAQTLWCWDGSSSVYEFLATAVVARQLREDEIKKMPNDFGVEPFNTPPSNLLKPLLNLSTKGGQFMYQPDLGPPLMLLDPERKRLFVDDVMVEWEHPGAVLGRFTRQTALSEDYALRSCREHRLLIGHDDRFKALSPDGRFVATGMTVYGIADGAPVLTFPVSTSAVAFAADGGAVLIADGYANAIMAIPLPRAAAPPPAVRAAPPAVKAAP